MHCFFIFDRHKNRQKSDVSDLIIAEHMVMNLIKVYKSSLDYEKIKRFQLVVPTV